MAIYRNVDHSIYLFSDISPNRSQLSKFDLSDLENDIIINHLSYCIDFTPKKLHDAIHLGSTSLLLNNIDYSITSKMAKPDLPTWQNYV